MVKPRAAIADFGPPRAHVLVQLTWQSPSCNRVGPPGWQLLGIVCQDDDDTAKLPRANLAPLISVPDSNQRGPRNCLYDPSNFGCLGHKRTTSPNPLVWLRIAPGHANTGRLQPREVYLSMTANGATPRWRVAVGCDVRQPPIPSVRLPRAVADGWDDRTRA